MSRHLILDNPAVRRAGLLLTGMAVVVLAIMPIFVVERGQEGFVTNSLLFSFTQMFMMIAMASSWNLTGGFTGYVDFGHAVWFGIGAYGTGVFMTKVGLSFPVATAGGVVVAVLAALLIGSATLRLRGPYFSIAMLATFVAMREIIRIAKPLTDGGEGMTLPPYLNRPLFFYVTLILAVLVVTMTWWLRRTQFGSTLIAIREDEVGADMRGIDTTLHKITVFAISAAITGLVGGLWAYQNTFIDPDIVFVERRTLDIIIATILGGLGTVAGPVIGSVAFYWLRDLMWSHFLHYHLIVTGVLLITLVMWVPEGIVGSLSDRSGATPLGRLLHRDRGARPTTSPADDSDSDDTRGGES
ncbi:MAG: branched-chain amino acid ABC transporter permease [Actinobacteria bacterium]|nr:branched-chain amino acid ABC transporter permease [Actinomycetota bacterium]